MIITLHLCYFFFLKFLIYFDFPAKCARVCVYFPPKLWSLFQQFFSWAAALIEPFFSSRMENEPFKC